MIEAVTFLLAMAGYACLTVAAVSAAAGRRSGIIRVTTVLVVAHVLLVWWVRYDWQLNQATRNGLAGFAIFHAALIAILGAPFAPDRIARLLVIAAFVTVSAGALGAVIRYDVVSVYRIPVVVCGVTGAVSLLRRGVTAWGTS